MTKRLQVLLDEAEWRQIQRSARAERTTVAEWVRRALRQARRSASSKDADHKLAAIRAAARHAFPAPDIDEMNAEIERGYRGESDS
jgi:predicted component of type VI protein secretion system